MRGSFCEFFSLSWVQYWYACCFLFLSWRLLLFHFVDGKFFFDREKNLPFSLREIPFLFFRFLLLNSRLCRSFSFLACLCKKDIETHEHHNGKVCKVSCIRESLYYSQTKENVAKTKSERRRESSRRSFRSSKGSLEKLTRRMQELWHEGYFFDHLLTLFHDPHQRMNTWRQEKNSRESSLYEELIREQEEWLTLLFLRHLKYKLTLRDSTK